MFAMVRAHWIDVGGIVDRLRRRPDGRRSVARRAAARPAQDLRGRQARRDALPRHQGQHPLSGILARRHEIADGGLPSRRAAHGRAVRQVRHATPCSRRSSRSSTRPSSKCRNVVAQLPDGVYEAEAVLDDDGVDKGEPVPIHVKVTIKGSDMTIDLSGCSKERKRRRQLAHACRRARRLQGADRRRSIRSTKARSARSRSIIPEGNIMMARYPGADGGLEHDRADGGRHHRHGAGAGDAGPHAGRRITACSAARWCSSACDPKTKRRFVRAEHRGRRLGRPAVRGRRVRHRLGLPGRRAQRLDRRHRAEMPGAGRGPRAAHGFRRRRQVSRRARPRHAGAQSRRGPLEFRADRAARKCPPWGLWGGEPTASTATICCRLPGENDFKPIGRRAPAGAGRDAR